MNTILILQVLIGLLELSSQIVAGLVEAHSDFYPLKISVDNILETVKQKKQEYLPKEDLLKGEK